MSRPATSPAMASPTSCSGAGRVAGHGCSDSMADDSPTICDVRGGGWSLGKYTLRTAQRIGDPPQQRNSHLGFRVVRELRH